MRTIVTGGLGFIGSSLVNRLHEEGHTVFNIDNHSVDYTLKNLNFPLDRYNNAKEYTWIDQDMSVDILSKFLAYTATPKDHSIVTSADLLVHLAALTDVDSSLVNPEKYITNNVGCTIQAMRLARALKVKKVVIVGSYQEYGSSDEGVPFTENDPTHPTSPYAASKAASTDIALSYGSIYDIDVSIVRLCSIFGVNQAPHKLIPFAIRTLHRGDKLTIYGNGLQLREWMYVDDAVDAILFIAGSGSPGGIYNAGSGYTLTNIHLARYIHSYLAERGFAKREFDSCVEFVKDRPAHDVSCYMDSSKIHALGWGDRCDIDNSMDAVIQRLVELHNV